jgi:hypothetical protein
VTLLTFFNRNARVDLRSCRTSFAVADATLGAAEDDVEESAIVFSLSVKLTVEPFCVRLHPSGTVIRIPAARSRNGTNTVLSGMSPGGLLSTGTGDSTGRGTVECVCMLGGVDVLEGTPGPFDVPPPALLAHAVSVRPRSPTTM